MFKVNSFRGSGPAIPSKSSLAADREIDSAFYLLTFLPTHNENKET